jgi:hypothetical protein
VYVSLCACAWGRGPFRYTFNSKIIFGSPPFQWDFLLAVSVWSMSHVLLFTNITFEVLRPQRNTDSKWRKGTTDDWSVTMSCCRAHYGNCVQLYFLSCFCEGALSDERTGLQFAVLSLSGPSRSKPVTIHYCLIWDSPNLEGQDPVFISPRNRMAQLHFRAQGPLYVASYNSQGSVGILTLLHTDLCYSFNYSII